MTTLHHIATSLLSAVTRLLLVLSLIVELNFLKICLRSKMMMMMTMVVVIVMMMMMGDDDG